MFKCPLRVVHVGISPQLVKNWVDDLVPELGQGYRNALIGQSPFIRWRGSIALANFSKAVTHAVKARWLMRT
jgi:hypothetical protein